MDGTLRNTSIIQAAPIKPFLSDRLTVLHSDAMSVARNDLLKNKSEHLCYFPLENKIFIKIIKSDLHFPNFIRTVPSLSRY
jgi:hypothetical protein